MLTPGLCVRPCTSRPNKPIICAEKLSLVLCQFHDVRNREKAKGRKMNEKLCLVFISFYNAGI